ncbi:AraC-type DNA-binding protein [Pilibacter termitis]|uniref:AraC-type DNA-binding protein n=1 Tax=Pilibacter termitis TaxID=263852 RepID=A0A1T4Q7A6_9ENTE|nr:AraC family transcriptional regulator [Pilibacter termitis]SJZ99589.1 AraC-type DNA-binding protein [Pilibacter termitis]
MKREVELVHHDLLTDMRVFVNNIHYRSTHLHKEIEFILVLSGELTVFTNQEKFLLKKGDFIVFNAFQPHEFLANDTAVIYVLQFLPTFFSSFKERLNEVEFLSTPISLSSLQEHKGSLKHFLHCGIDFYQRKENFQLLVKGHAYFFVYHLLSSMNTNILSTKERQAKNERLKQIETIYDFIHENFREKISMTALAERYFFSPNYFSHFFKTNFGTSFQNYLKSLRTTEAERLLKCSKLNLLEIAFECGFSDVKYLNQAIKEKHNLLPKEYRKLQPHANSKMEKTQTTSIDQQQILSTKKSLEKLLSFLSELS